MNNGSREKEQDRLVNLSWEGETPPLTVFQLIMSPEETTVEVLQYAD